MVSLPSQQGLQTGLVTPMQGTLRSGMTSVTSNLTGKLSPQCVAHHRAQLPPGPASDATSTSPTQLSWEMSH